MSEHAPSLFDTILFVLWVVVDLATAGVAFFRFRATLSGLLIGGAFGVIALKMVVVRVAQRTVLSGLSWEDPGRWGTSAASMALTALLVLIVAVGVLLVPRSLGKLAAAGSRHR